MDLARWCRLDTAGARRAIHEVTAATAQWRRVAGTNGIAASSITSFADAFEFTARGLATVAGTEA